MTRFIALRVGEFYPTPITDYGCALDLWRVSLKVSQKHSIYCPSELIFKGQAKAQARCDKLNTKPEKEM